MAQTELRVVLLGKTGSGKSSVGNTLLGREAFRVARGFGSGTARCQWADAHKDGLDLQVTDTPGLCDTHRKDEDILREVGKSIALANPGPHIVLMVLRADKRFTEEESNAYDTLKGLFGPDIRTHMIVVFTGVGGFGSTIETQTSKLRVEVKNCPGRLTEILADAGGRYIGVDNMSTQMRKEYAKKMIEVMLGLVSANSGDFFRNTVCEEVGTVIEPLIQQKMTTKKLTRPLAIKATNKSIVKDEAPPSTLRKVKSIVEDALKSVLEDSAEDAAKSSAEYISETCSMM